MANEFYKSKAIFLFSFYTSPPPQNLPEVPEFVSSISTGLFEKIL